MNLTNCPICKGELKIRYCTARIVKLVFKATLKITGWQN